jgi:hypothetical protein
VAEDLVLDAYLRMFGGLWRGPLVVVVRGALGSGRRRRRVAEGLVLNVHPRLSW